MKYHVQFSVTSKRANRQHTHMCRYSHAHIVDFFFYFNLVIAGVKYDSIIRVLIISPFFPWFFFWEGMNMLTANFNSSATFFSIFLLFPLFVLLFQLGSEKQYDTEAIIMRIFLYFITLMQIFSTFDH